MAKNFKQIANNTTKKELIELLVGIGNCPSHFYKPTIIENDPDFKLGEKAQVICQQCVERLRDILGLTNKEEFPSHLQVFGE